MDRIDLFILDVFLLLRSVVAAVPDVSCRQVLDHVLSGPGKDQRIEERSVEFRCLESVDMQDRYV